MYFLQLKKYGGVKNMTDMRYGEHIHFFSNMSEGNGVGSGLPMSQAKACVSEF